MRRFPIPRGLRWHRAVIAVLLVVGVLLITGPPPSSAAVDPVAGMAAMEGMPAATGVQLPTGSVPDGAAVTGCALTCGDLLEACLAVLTLLVTAAMGLPSQRPPVRAGPWCSHAGRARRRVAGASPPWSVPSLSQLSVLRV